MSKNLNTVEDVEIALNGMAKFQRRVSKRLKADENEKEAVREAFGELGQYAATIQDDEDLIAFSDTLYHIINEAPTLRGFLPKKVSDAPKTKDLSLELDYEVHQQNQERQHADERAAEMGNRMHVITGTQTPQRSADALPQVAADRSSLLSRILQSFREAIGLGSK